MEDLEDFNHSRFLGSGESTVEGSPAGTATGVGEPKYDLRRRSEESFG